MSVLSFLGVDAPARKGSSQDLGAPFCTFSRRGKRLSVKTTPSTTSCVRTAWSLLRHAGVPAGFCSFRTVSEVGLSRRDCPIQVSWFVAVQVVFACVVLTVEVENVPRVLLLRFLVLFSSGPLIISSSRRWKLRQRVLARTVRTSLLSEPVQHNFVTAACTNPMEFSFSRRRRPRQEFAFLVVEKGRPMSRSSCVFPPSSGYNEIRGLDAALKCVVSRGAPSSLAGMPDSRLASACLVLEGRGRGRDIAVGVFLRASWVWGSRIELGRVLFIEREPLLLSFSCSFSLEGVAFE